MRTINKSFQIGKITQLKLPARAKEILITSNWIGVTNGAMCICLDIDTGIEDGAISFKDVKDAKARTHAHFEDGKLFVDFEEVEVSKTERFGGSVPDFKECIFQNRGIETIEKQYTFHNELLGNLKEIEKVARSLRASFTKRYGRAKLTKKTAFRLVFEDNKAKLKMICYQCEKFNCQEWIDSNQTEHEFFSIETSKQPISFDWKQIQFYIKFLTGNKITANRLVLPTRKNKAMVMEGSNHQFCLMPIKLI